MALDTLEYDYTIHQRQNAGDENLLVKFYKAPMEDSAASLKAGRPIFKQVDWIDIRVPGSRDTRVRPARARDKERFSQHYAAFKARTEHDDEEVVGTPLELWPVVGASQAAELRFFNIRTVENLAGAADSVGQKFMGLQDLKAKAKAFLEAAKGTAPIIELQKRMDTLEKQNAELQEEVTDYRAKEKARRKRRKLRKAKG